MRIRRYVGKHLKPRPRAHGPAAVGVATFLTMAAPAQAGTHTVSPGETLSQIAARYGVSVDSLARANQIRDPDRIFAGTRLRVPTGDPGIRHRVRQGDTLESLSRRYGTTVKAIARANRLENPNLIVAGALLRIPGAGTTSPDSAGTRMPITTNIGELLESHATHHGVNPSLVKAVAWQESGWNQSARSSAGAIGIMQVMPDTARYVNDVLGGGDLDIRHAEDNVHLGVMYLRRMIDVMPSVEKALAAYYAGPGNVGQDLERGQKSYVDNVRALQDRF